MSDSNHVSLVRWLKEFFSIHSEVPFVMLVQMLEGFWLASSSYVAGDQVSVADLLLVTELDMLHMLAGATEVRFTTRPDRILYGDVIICWQANAFLKGEKRSPTALPQLPHTAQPNVGSCLYHHQM